MAKKCFKDWLESFEIDTKIFPSYPKTLLNDGSAKVRLDYQGKNTGEGEFIHRLAVQKTGHMKSSVTMATKPNTVIARVDANSTASWEEIREGFFKSYENKCKVYQGVVDGDWVLKPMKDTPKAAASNKGKKKSKKGSEGA